MNDPLTNALSRILRPLVRVAIARGVTFPVIADILRDLYVSEAIARDDAKPTDSRISLLTGLQRREVKARREAGAAQADRGMGVLPRILARWRADPAYAIGADPRPLSRKGEGSFEALVAEVSRDMHPRTALDALRGLGRVEIDDEDRVVPVSADFLPVTDMERLASYLAANLGDHAEAAVANLLAAPERGPYFERALHYNYLSAESLAALDARARQGHAALLAELNEMALTQQTMDRAAGSGAFRVRFGAYLYNAPMHDDETEEDSQ